MATRQMHEDGAASDDPLRPFLVAARLRAHHPAVEMGDSFVSYAQLEAMARRLAARFVAVGVPRVLIVLPQGADAYAAMIGAILSGGCYVPVSSATPANKLARLVETVAPNVIVAAQDAAEWAAAVPAALRVDPAQLTDADPLLQGAGLRHETAYVIFTSGSTGSPKGVVVSNRALAHYVAWLCDSQLIRADDRVSQFPDISFDLSVLDVYGTLSAGATLVPATARGDRLFPADFVRRSRISVWVSVPSAIELVITGRQARGEMLGSVRLFAFCGEPLRPVHLAAIFQACPAVSVLNLYGPTEATVSMTSVLLRTDTYPTLCADSAPLGDPIPDMELLLLGGDHPDQGEIVITGPQLATEYWQDPQRTAQSFQMICRKDGAVRAYFTGDWGERSNGHVYFKGRIDRQIKIRGYRIEAGEVLARLADCGWPVACVLKHRDALVAVIECGSGETVDLDALRARLHAELDAHAVPQSIHVVHRMPRNQNGKLDENAVRAWLESGGELTAM